jgi:hypothetical protein
MTEKLGKPIEGNMSTMKGRQRIKNEKMHEPSNWEKPEVGSLEILEQPMTCELKLINLSR